MRAILGMYPFAPWWPAYEQLWGALRREVPWLPDHLEQTADPRAARIDPEVVFTQACAYPLVTELFDRVRVVGSFSMDVPGAEGWCYRSVIAGTRQVPQSEWATLQAAANSPDSLSGSISLNVAIHGSGAPLAEPSLYTGGHRASVAALRNGRADIASIDAVTFAALGEEDPSPTDGLVVLGEGPLVPTLPIISPHMISDGQLAELRAGLVSVCSDPALQPVLSRLHITGFQPLELDDYVWLRDLVQ